MIQLCADQMHHNGAIISKSLLTDQLSSSKKSLHIPLYALSADLFNSRTPGPIAEERLGC